MNASASNCSWERLLESQSDYIANLQRMLQSACHNASSLSAAPPPVTAGATTMASSTGSNPVHMWSPALSGGSTEAPHRLAGSTLLAASPLSTPLASPTMQPPVPPPMPPVPPPAKQAWPFQSPADEGAGGCAIERLAATAAVQRDERATSQGGQPRGDSLSSSFRGGVARADALIGSLHSGAHGSNGGSHVCPTGLATATCAGTSPLGSHPPACGACHGAIAAAGAGNGCGGDGGGSGMSAGAGGTTGVAAGPGAGGLAYPSTGTGPHPHSNRTAAGEAAGVTAQTGLDSGHDTTRSHPGSAAVPPSGSAHSPPVAAPHTLALTSTSLAGSRSAAQTPPPPPLGLPTIPAESCCSQPPTAGGATAGGTVGVIAQYEQTANEVLRLRLLKSQHEEIRQQLIRAEGQLRRLPPQSVFQFRAYLEKNLHDYNLALQVQQPIIRLLECLCVVCKVEVPGLTPEALLSSARKLLRDTHNFTSKLSGTPHFSGEEVRGLAPFLLAGTQYRRVKEKDVNDCYEAFHAWLSAFYIYSSVSDQIAPTTEALGAQEWLLRRLNGQVVEQQPLCGAAPALVPPVATWAPPAPTAAMTSPSAPVGEHFARSCAAAGSASGGSTTRPDGSSSRAGGGGGNVASGPGAAGGSGGTGSRALRSSGLTSPGSRGRPGSDASAPPPLRRAGIAPASPTAPRASPLQTRPRGDTATGGGVYSSRSPSPGSTGIGVGGGGHTGRQGHDSTLRVTPGRQPLRGGGGGGGGGARTTSAPSHKPSCNVAAPNSVEGVPAQNRRTSFGHDHAEPSTGPGHGGGAAVVTDRGNSKASSPGLTRVQSEKVLQARSPRAAGATTSGMPLGSRSPSPTSGIGTGRAMSPRTGRTQSPFPAQSPPLSQSARPLDRLGGNEGTARTAPRLRPAASSTICPSRRQSAPLAVGRSAARPGGRLNSPGKPRGMAGEAGGSGKTPRSAGADAAAPGPSSGARGRPGAVPEVQEEEDVSGDSIDDEEEDDGFGPHRRRLSTKQYEALVRCAQQVVALSSVPP